MNYPSVFPDSGALAESLIRRVRREGRRKRLQLRGRNGCERWEPRVLIEPGSAAVMACTGVGFAGSLAEHLKAHQTRAQHP